MFCLKKNAAGRIMQRGVKVETARDILYKRQDISCDTLYATKLLNQQGVVVWRQ
jgi:hypothetical protein